MQMRTILTGQNAGGDHRHEQQQNNTPTTTDLEQAARSASAGRGSPTTDALTEALLVLTEQVEVDLEVARVAGRGSPDALTERLLPRVILHDFGS